MWKICLLMVSLSELKHVEDNIIPPCNILWYILPNKRINKVKLSHEWPGQALSVPGG
jgi:hypothetical protein